MPALHKNRVKMTVTSVASAGVGTITLNAASSAHQSFATAYGADATVDILITEGTSWEVARNCTYTHSGTTVTRGTLEASSTGSAVTFTSAATVEEILTAGVGNSFTDFVGAWGGLNEENAITGTATAVFGKLNVCSGTSADYTVTLPAVSGNGGKYLGLRMDAALTKLVTIDGNSSETIDGALTRVMWAQETALLYCNGTTWTKIAGKSIPMLAKINRDTLQTGIPNATFTKILFDTSVIDSPAGQVDTANSKLVCKRDGVYQIISGAIVAADGTGGTHLAAAARILSIVYANTTEVARGESYHANAVVYEITVAVGNASLVAGDELTMKLYQNSGGDCSYFGDAGCDLQMMEILKW